ncbi:hypothetical protein [Micromonospora pallida]|uniref:hypothetical protein n=1 Tax=Micromonospora pallida TaxID=145854 RepID=UPI00114D2156|nr:hypothetical protein [Micromonospora pallida]
MCADRAGYADAAIVPGTRASAASARNDRPPAVDAGAAADAGTDAEARAAADTGADASAAG